MVDQPRKGSWYHRKGDEGGSWKAITGVVTRDTGIRFPRKAGIRRMPYVTLRRGDRYVHLAEDEWDTLDGTIIHWMGSEAGRCPDRDQEMRYLRGEEEIPAERWNAPPGSGPGEAAVIYIAAHKGNVTCPICKTK